MAWTIHSWSPADSAGTIASPHFGPIPFGAAANVDAVADFEVGEEVWVEIDGRTEQDFIVRTIRPRRQRQPPETRWPPFDAVNGRFSDAFIEERSAETLQLWLGECCAYCTPNATRLRFEGISALRGLDGDYDFDEPLFRLASADEIRDNDLSTPEGSTAFCIVSSHGNGPDGGSVFVVARRARLI